MSVFAISLFLGCLSARLRPALALSLSAAAFGLVLGAAVLSSGFTLMAFVNAGMALTGFNLGLTLVFVAGRLSVLEN